MISVFLPGAGSFQKEMPSTSASSSITTRAVGASRCSVRRTCRQLVTWGSLALWFNRGMGPKIQRFISAVISP